VPRGDSGGGSLPAVAHPDPVPRAEFHGEPGRKPFVGRACRGHFPAAGLSRF
jgi:hypothetical protein